MDVEKGLRTEGNLPVDRSTTSPPDVNITPLTKRASQFESSFVKKLLGRLPLLGLTVLGLIYDSPPAFSQKVNNNSSNSAENTLIIPDTLPAEKASDQVEDSGVGQDYTRTYIDPLGNKIEWRVLNGTDGVPPNNPDHSIDKIFVSVNSLEAIPFQFNETQFPPDTYHIAVGGHWMDTKLNIAYAPIMIARNSTGGGRALPYIGIVLDARNVTKLSVIDASKQKLVTDLPQGGTYGDSFKYFKVGSDNKGLFIKFGIQYSIDPKEDGDYMIRLDSNGLPVGGPVKIESAVMSRRGFIPFIGNTYTGK